MRLKLDQDLIFTRNAFQATLEIENNDPEHAIEEVSLRIGTLTADGRAADDRFEIRDPQLRALTSVDGAGSLAPATRGVATWVLVPSPDAAPEGPVNYAVGGVLSYRQAGRTLTVPLASVPITVQPDPRLLVRYFHQRDVFSDDPFTPVVEPSLPYSLAVMIENQGKGTARDVQITSAQPKIIENEKGLLIDFQILGTEVAGRTAEPSLTVQFGQIDPGQISIGRWLLTSSLQGLFVDYQASVAHGIDERDRKSSIVDAVSIHEMIHLVQAQGSWEDGRPDFLVNDVPDAEDLPDLLYLSDGTIERVSVQREADFEGNLSANTLSVSMTTTASEGWSYLRIPDPGRGQFLLREVTRSDGVVLAFGTNVWTSDRTFVGQGRKPRREALLHLLDRGGPGRYTLSYRTSTPVDLLPPTSRVSPLPTESHELIPVSWSGSDDPGGSGIAGYEVLVSVNGGPFTTWVAHTPDLGAVYQGQLGNRYTFQCRATDHAGNREAEPGQPAVGTRVSLENHAPTLAVIPDQAV
ncbi:MAG: hypothetical protein IT580_08760, partial [Verrucomicrobiales bacterium]|nr:hypothetical protein [Verrucomicrobiales bacterium]